MAVDMTDQIENIKRLLGARELERAIDLFNSIYKVNPEVFEQRPALRGMVYDFVDISRKVVDPKERKRYEEIVDRLPAPVRELYQFI